MQPLRYKFKMFMCKILILQRGVNVGATWLLGGLKLNKSSRGMEGRFQDMLSRMAATFLFFPT